MGTVSLTNAERLLWAKTGPQGAWHPLWCHMVDVGSVTAERFHRAPSALRMRIVRWLRSVDEDDAAAFLSVLAGLHDLGKCSPPFQAKVPERKRALLDLGVKGWPLLQGTPHPHFTAALARGALIRRFPDQQCRKGLRLLIEAVAIHHGGLDAAGGYDNAKALLDASDRFWMRAVDSLTGLLCDIFALKRLPPIVEDTTFPSHLVMWLAGFVSVSDWIGSDTEAFPFAPLDASPRDYRSSSVTRACQVLDRLVLDEPVRFVEATFPDRFGFQPRRLQEITRALVSSVADGPVLLVIECPMGEGKSEAALDACAELCMTLDGGGFFMGLPTQATTNAMHDRVRGWLSRSTLDQPYLRLAHGAAALRVDMRRDRVQAARIYEPGGDPEQSALAAAEWFSSSKRALLDRCGVGTVDQALLGVLPVRHGFVRLGALAGRVVILDEVHAYDEYTGHLVQRLVSWLGAQGTSVILLSATLSSATRERIIEEWCSATGQQWTAHTSAYPRISLITPSTSRSDHVPATASRGLRITVDHVDDDIDPVIERIGVLLGDGGCIGWVCNTVARAQAVFRRLSQRVATDVELDLLHARFTLHDRERIERRALERIGPKGHRPVRCILVGTQVIEQSLDLDFDLLVSDLAPVDLILQRAGRLHRHEGRVRPELLRQPRLIVLGSRAIADLDPRRVGVVYSPTVLLLSRYVLACEHIDLPADIERLVEAVYSRRADWGDIPTQIRDLITHTAHRDEALAMAREGLAEARALNVAGSGHPWARLQAGRLDSDDADGDPTATRLGEPSIPLVILHDIHQRCCLDPDGDHPVDLSEAPSWDLTRQLVRASINVTRRSLRGATKALLDAAPPRWKDQPALRRSGLLVLKGGTAQRGGVDFSYSVDSGLSIGAAAVPEGRE
jgi:CRISPR-associated endonuclease/helicase Cas3